MSKSILQSKKECYVCGSELNLHLHHIIFGKNRKKADEDGLVVYLCWEHHEGTKGVHGKKGKWLDQFLKKRAEEKWITYYKKTEENFIKRYHKNYL